MLNLAVNNKNYKKFRLYVDVYLRDHIGKSNFYIPTVNELCNFISEKPGVEDLHAEMIHIYNGYFGQLGDIEGISDEIKVNQISAMDGLVYGYNLRTEEMLLYSANPNLLDGVKTFDLAKTIENNKEGYIHAMRIDVKYLDLNQSYEAKAVRLSGVRKLDIEDFIFIPGYVINRLCDMLYELMKDGRVVQIEHDSDGASYKRHVSLNESVLSDYNGGEKPLHQIRVVDFRYTGRLYLPVVGAPLSSAGITKVDFKDIDRIQILDRRQAHEIKQADNSLWSVIRSEVFGSFVDLVFTVEDESYKKQLWQVLNSLGEGEKDLPYTANKYEYLRAIRDLDNDNQDLLYNSLGAGLHAIGERLKDVITMIEPADVPETFWDLKGMLRDGVYRVVTMRQSGSFYSVYATENDEILAHVYGPDYVTRFDGPGRKLQYFRDNFDNSMSLIDNIVGAGLGSVIEGIADNEVEAKFREFVNEQDNKTSGGGGASGGDSGNIRILFNPETSASYYRRISVNKIYSITRVG